MTENHVILYLTFYEFFLIKEKDVNSCRDPKNHSSNTIPGVTNSQNMKITIEMRESFFLKAYNICR